MVSANHAFGPATKGVLPCPVMARAIAFPNAAFYCPLPCIGNMMTTGL
jgi:hypothetical protein